MRLEFIMFISRNNVKSFFWITFNFAVMISVVIIKVHATEQRRATITKNDMSTYEVSLSVGDPGTHLMHSSLSPCEFACNWHFLQGSCDQHTDRPRARPSAAIARTYVMHAVRAKMQKSECYVHASL